MSTIVLSGTVTLHKGTGAEFSAKLVVDMITENIGRIIEAEVAVISKALIGQLIYLEAGVIYTVPENAFWRDDPSP